MTTWILGLALMLAPGTVAPQDHAREELRRYVFTIEIDGIATGSFREVIGLGIETEVIEFRDGNSNDIRKLPGATKWPDITLKRGFTGNKDFYDWATTHQRTGQVVRRNASIVLYDQTGAPVARYHIQNAWPVKYNLSPLESDGNAVAVETLVIAHEGFMRVDDR